MANGYTEFGEATASSATRKVGTPIYISWETSFVPEGDASSSTSSRRFNPVSEPMMMSSLWLTAVAASEAEDPAGDAAAVSGVTGSFESFPAGTVVDTVPMGEAGS